MKRALAGFAALSAVLLVQLTIVNGLRLPGGGVPDLVLLGVVALGLTGGPGWGVMAGFCAGLSLDLAPPADQLAGQYALVLCLAGYAAGRLRFTLRYSALAALAAAGVAAVAAEVFGAALTLSLDTPEVTAATVVRLLPTTVLYDLVLMPVVLLVAVRAAVALGVSLDPLDDSPALESGGSAGPAAVAGRSGSGAHVRPRQAGQRLAVGGDRRAAASGRWLVGDVAEAAPAVGAIGWLGGPVRTRRGRREQARLTAMVTGASPRRGAFWVGARPSGLTPVTPPRAGASGLTRLRPGAGVAGSAAPGARPGPAGAGRGPARPVRLGLATEQRRQTRAAGRARRAARGGLGTGGLGTGGTGTGGLDHGLDRHGVGGPGLPSIAFGTGSQPTAGQGARRKVPSIAFGAGRAGAGQGRRAVPGIAFGGRRAGAAQGARRTVPGVAFGGGRAGARQGRRAVPGIAFRGGRAGAAQGARRNVPGIAFRGSRAGAGQGARRVLPGIAFRSAAGLGPHRRGPMITSGPAGRAAGGGGRRTVPAIAFGSPARARAGARRPKQPHFARASAHQPGRPHRAKTARFSAGRRRSRLLPAWLHPAGGRSTVWRIASARVAGTKTGSRR